MSLESFKLKIRKWNPECPCRLCKTYLKHVDSIWSCSYLFYSPPLEILHLTFWDCGNEDLFWVCGKSFMQMRIQGAITLLRRNSELTLELVPLVPLECRITIKIFVSILYFDFKWEFIMTWFNFLYCCWRYLARKSQCKSPLNK